MKKLTILLAALLLSAGAASAQEPVRPLFRYQGEVSLRGQVAAPTTGFGLSYINGARINHYLFVGGGIGFHSNNYGIYIPLSLDVKGYLPISRSSDFMLFCDGGLMFNMNRSDNHGFIRPGFGLNFRVVKSFAINIGFYYEYAPYSQDVYIKSPNIYATVTQPTHSIGFALGFSF